MSLPDYLDDLDDRANKACCGGTVLFVPAAQMRELCSLLREKDAENERIVGIHGQNKYISDLQAERDRLKAEVDYLSKPGFDGCCTVCGAPRG